MKMSKPLFYGVDLSDIEETGESPEPVQYVGVYVLKWNKTIEPTIGFVPVDLDLDKLLTTARQVVQRANHLRGYEIDAAGGTSSFFRSLRELEELVKEEGENGED
jgi:hypothetical protein